MPWNRNNMRMNVNEAAQLLIDIDRREAVLRRDTMRLETERMRLDKERAAFEQTLASLEGNLRSFRNMLASVL